MIYITGDIHGDRKRLSWLKLRNLKEGDTLIICGDFGFIWDNSLKEKRNLNFNLPIFAPLNLYSLHTTRELSKYILHRDIQPHQKR